MRRKEMRKRKKRKKREKERKERKEKEREIRRNKGNKIKWNNKKMKIKKKWEGSKQKYFDGISVRIRKKTKKKR